MWNGFKDSGRNSRFFEGKAHHPPQERGFHRFFFHGGENPQIPQNPGSFEGEKPKAHGGIKDPMPRENLKTPKVASPGDLIAIDILDIRPLPGRVYQEFPPETLSPGGPLPPSIPGPRPISPECSSRNSERYPLSSASHSGRWRE